MYPSRKNLHGRWRRRRNGERERSTARHLLRFVCSVIFTITASLYTRSYEWNITWWEGTLAHYAPARSFHVSPLLRVVSYISWPNSILAISPASSVSVICIIGMTCSEGWNVCLLHVTVSSVSALHLCCFSYRESWPCYICVCIQVVLCKYEKGWWPAVIFSNREAAEHRCALSFQSQGTVRR